MDFAKVSAVTNWPTPTSLSWFNNLPISIEDLSETSLHTLTSPHVKFMWSFQAEQSFQRLKKCFTSTPILTLAEPRWQFTVEVDASDMGIRAILSQRSPEDNNPIICGA